MFYKSQEDIVINKNGSSLISLRNWVFQYYMEAKSDSLHDYIRIMNQNNEYESYIDDITIVLAML